MLSFGVKNLRRLKDVGPVQIKPITILVGRNSSGKSSFLRAFPLLRQSLMTRTSSPILWYGDFVDFGSFEGSVSDNNKDQSISLRFGIDRMTLPFRGRYQYYQYSGNPTVIENSELEVRITSTNEKTQISALNLTFGPDRKKIELSINDRGDAEGLLFDGHDVWPMFAPFHVTISPGTIFPDLLILAEEKNQLSRLAGVDGALLVNEVELLLTPHIDKRIKPGVISQYAARLLTMSCFTKEGLRLLAEQSEVRSWKRLLLDVIGKDSKALFGRLLFLHGVNQFPILLNAASELLRQTISSTLYIGPARARSVRYYRYQDLSVSEIDAEGDNFPMFLNSLTGRQLDSLSDWVQSLFGYRIDVGRSTGHISINLVEGPYSTNIVDSGYGVSQILPVLGQIWWAVNRRQGFRPPSRQGRDSIIAIEQPELHLHPAHQALLADAFADPKLRGNESDRFNFLIETHSETFVNRLGELIAEEKLKAEDVQILLFEPDRNNARSTVVRIANFNDNGELVNWPFGFFQPDYSK